MNELIIQKFNLIETDIKFGLTFINEIKVYRYKNTDVLLAKCDSTGEHSEYILIFRDNFEAYTKLTEQFLLHIPIDVFEYISNPTQLSATANH